MDLQREVRQGATEKIVRISEPIEFPRVRLSDQYTKTISDAGNGEYDRLLKDGNESLHSSVYNSLLQSSA